MKDLKFCHLCLIGAVILGLMVAWNGAVPAQLSTNDVIGGDCWICTDCGHADCDDWPGAELCYRGPYRIECNEMLNPYAIEYIPCSWMDATPCGGPPDDCSFMVCKSCP